MHFKIELGSGAFGFVGACKREGGLTNLYDLTIEQDGGATYTIRGIPEPIFMQLPGAAMHAMQPISPKDFE